MEKTIKQNMKNIMKKQILEQHLYSVGYYSEVTSHKQNTYRPVICNSNKYKKIMENMTKI